MDGRAYPSDLTDAEYAVLSPHLPGPAGLDVAAAWLAERRSPWERRLDRLGDALAELDQPTARRDEQG